MSAIFISKIMPQDFDSKKAMLLYHLVLSHHGINSPVECKMKEANILNFADGLSSRMRHLDLLSFTNHWSKFDELTKRAWYIE